MQLNPHQYSSGPYQYIKPGPSRILGYPSEPYGSQGPYISTGCMACDQARGYYSPFYSSPSHINSHRISRDRLTPKYLQKSSYVISSSHQNIQQRSLINQPPSNIQSAPMQTQRRISYQPYMRKYIEYQDYIQYVPVQRSEWNYQQIMKQIEFVPKEYYQTKIQYYPKEKIEQKVRWVPVEQQIVHVPQDVLVEERNIVSINRQIHHQIQDMGSNVNLNVNVNRTMVNNSFNPVNNDFAQLRRVQTNQIIINSPPFVNSSQNINQQQPSQQIRQSQSYSFPQSGGVMIGGGSSFLPMVSNLNNQSQQQMNSKNPLNSHITQLPQQHSHRVDNDNIPEYDSRQYRKSQQNLHDKNNGYEYYQESSSGYNYNYQGGFKKNQNNTNAWIKAKRQSLVDEIENQIGYN